MHMVATVQKWNKNAEKFRRSRNGKMCKGEWNEMNCNYNKILDYHKGIGHHKLFLELTMEEHDWYHLLRQFNKENYETIDEFLGG